MSCRRRAPDLGRLREPRLVPPRDRASAFEDMAAGRARPSRAEHGARLPGVNVVAASNPQLSGPRCARMPQRLRARAGLRPLRRCRQCEGRPVAHPCDRAQVDETTRFTADRAARLARCRRVPGGPGSRRSDRTWLGRGARDERCESCEITVVVARAWIAARRYRQARRVEPRGSAGAGMLAANDSDREARIGCDHPLVAHSRDEQTGGLGRQAIGVQRALVGPLSPTRRREPVRRAWWSAAMSPGASASAAWSRTGPECSGEPVDRAGLPFPRRRKRTSRRCTARGDPLRVGGSLRPGGRMRYRGSVVRFDLDDLHRVIVKCGAGLAEGLAQPARARA